MRSRLVVLSVALLVWVFDFASKQWALRSLGDGSRIHLVGESFLQLTANSGAAFSMGTDHTWVFTLLSVAVLVGILVHAARVSTAVWRIGLGGLAGGAAGNLTDRLLQPPSPGFGRVVDFIMVGNFPVFNLADSAIVCSVALMFLASARNIPMTRSEQSQSTLEEPHA